MVVADGNTVRHYSTVMARSWGPDSYSPDSCSPDSYYPGSCDPGSYDPGSCDLGFMLWVGYTGANSYCSRRSWGTWAVEGAVMRTGNFLPCVMWEGATAAVLEVDTVHCHPGQPAFPSG